MGKFTEEQRLDIGRRIYHGEISTHRAAEKYGIGYYTAREYMRAYRDTYGLPPKERNNDRSRSSPKDLEDMTREELIQALIQARDTEAQLNKKIQSYRSVSVTLQNLCDYISKIS